MVGSIRARPRGGDDGIVDRTTIGERPRRAKTTVARPRARLRSGPDRDLPRELRGVLRATPVRRRCVRPSAVGHAAEATPRAGPRSRELQRLDVAAAASPDPLFPRIPL